MKYGVLSDIHSNPTIVPIAIASLKSQGAERLLVNGDVFSLQKTLQETQNQFAYVLDWLGKSGLETIVQPGSHEIFLAYESVIEYFASKYSNLINGK